ncbi:MAG: DUF4442 domain-containing protein [Bdellovibrionales bacterium]|nr:DUF4442 domain-containing protein [Bdellovibrionales bacterium]
MSRLFGVWAPYLGAGIRVRKISDDFKYIRVELPLTWYNRNYVGVHFGGSLYAMTDPFYMFQLLEILGSEYIVWDKGATIDFVKPGKSTVHVEFKWTDEEIAEVKKKADENEKYIFDKPVTVYDIDKNVIAKIDKRLYVRKKRN